MTPRTYQAMAIRTAIKLYAETGIKVNTAYTPTKMLRTARDLTGKHFNRGQYQEAFDALTEVIGDGKIYQLRVKRHG